jgi:hypothetical protein
MGAYIFNFGWLYDLIKMLVEDVFGFQMGTTIGESVHFFFYDVIKIIILLSFMIFLVTYIRSYFPLEKTKRIIEKYGGLSAHIMASLLGIVTPFCSCSSVPLFIGFVEAGIPIGVTFSFLITSPIVNEAAFAILLGTFGWKIALFYVLAGVVVGVVGGLIIRILKMEKEVEAYVYEMKAGSVKIDRMTQNERFSFAKDHVAEIIKKVWLYLLIGIGIGAIIHGWAPAELLSKYAGPDNPIAVIVAVVFGIPLYSNALGTIPIAEALINKGVGIGTALSFMMAVTALSLPEMILLRKVIKPKLIAAFVIIAGIAIIIVGYLFNWIL